MDIEAALNEKLEAIRAEFKAKTGWDLHEASLWFYGDHWVVFITADEPFYQSHSGHTASWAGIDVLASEVIDTLAARVLHKPTAAEIAQRVGVSEAELCQIVCATKHEEAA